ncbi:glutathione S-transferase N-terminal domain-containing protein [Lentibacter algarum]|uniref:glutathione S-transferase family protein n=1 Tax=Lentibacter algarum TaxID=576131 RepID=UPI001C094AB9|nr:glutathione S-transferase [Lentibacter algarum]MBU2983054.1 glutathione S-transferase N-terminal domain-containing protein [Lentibacter algarum]
MTLKLHCFGESGNAYKAALALELSGLDWEPVYVDFFGGEARSQEYRAKNIMGEVPMLEDGDIRLCQSGVIQQYVTDKSGKLGGAPSDKYEVLRWVLWDNHKNSSQTGITRFLLNFLPEDKRPQEAINFLQGRLKAVYATLDAHLEGRDWLVGDAITNADIANCGYLFYPEPFGFERKEWANIDRWLTNIQQTPGWKAPYDLMPGSPADRA